MSIQKYRAFVKTAETGSITLAARQLGYTQSAVSKMIKDLEDEWGVTLLTRGRGGAVLSSDGLTLLPTVMEMLRSEDNLRLSLSALHGHTQGTLRLGCFSSVSSAMLPAILKRFKESYPGIQVNLFHGEYGEISEWLRKGTIDCGFLGENEASEFDSTPVFSDSLVAVVPADHPLAGSGVYPVSRFETDSFIGLKEEHDYDFAQFFDRHGITPNTAYEVTSDMVLLSMVEAGLGVSIVYEKILEPHRFNVTRLELDKTKQRTVYIASGRDDPRASEAARLFINCTKDYVG